MIIGVVIDPKLLSQPLPYFDDIFTIKRFSPKEIDGCFFYEDNESLCTLMSQEKIEILLSDLHMQCDFPHHQITMLSLYSSCPTREFLLQCVYKICNGNGMLMNRNDFITRNVDQSGLWEDHVTKTIGLLLYPDDVAIDAGAHVGIHTVTMLNQGATVHSFEPISYNRTLLEINAPKAIIHEQALSDECSATCIDYKLRSPFQQSNMGDFSIGRGNYYVPTATIDSFDLAPRLIKIDVQGAEKKLLLGAEKTIRDSRPYMIIELENHQLEKMGTTSSDIIDYLTSINYTVFLIDSGYPSDHLCVPNEKVRKFKKKEGIKIVANKPGNEINNSFELGVTEKIIFV